MGDNNYIDLRAAGLTDQEWERIFAKLQADLYSRYSLRQSWGSITQDVIDFEISPAWRQIIEQELPPRPLFTLFPSLEDSPAKGLPSIPVARAYIPFAQVTHENLITSVNELIGSMWRRNCVGHVLHCRASKYHLELEMFGRRLEAAQSPTPPPDAYLP